MRKFLFLLVAAVFCCNVSVCLAQKSVNVWTFDANGPSSDGWTVGKYWKFGDAGALFYARIANGSDTLISPVSKGFGDTIYSPSVVLRFRNVPYTTARNVRLNGVRVLCRPDANSEFEEAWSGTIAAADGTRQKFPLPPQYSSGTVFNVQLAIVVDYYGGVSTSISEVAIENADMEQPSGLSISPAYNGARFTFTPDNNANSYTYKISSHAIDPEMGVADVIAGVNTTENSVQIYDDAKFNPNTTYHFYLQGDFGEEGKTVWLDTTFRTEDTVSIPYKVDFENSLDPRIRIVRSATGTKNEVVSEEQSHGGNRSFYFNEAKGKYGSLILPAIKGDIKDYQLSFWVYRDATVGTRDAVFSIQVASDSLLTNKASRMDLRIPDSKRGEWVRCVVQFDVEQTFVGSRIVIEAGTANGANSLYIDDIEISAKSGCPMPMFVEAYDITASGATLSWLDGSGKETEWNVHISKTPVEDMSGITPNPGMVNSLPYTVSLDASDEVYYVYVQKAGSCVSEWTEGMRFRTKKALSCPYKVDFSRDMRDSLPEAWLGSTRNLVTDGYYSSLSKPAVFQGENVDHTGGAGVPKSLRLPADSTSTGSSRVCSYVILPELACGDLGSKAISFWAKSTGNMRFLVGFAKVQNGYENKTTEVGLQFGLKGQPANITIVDTLPFTTPNEWQEMFCSFSNYQRQYKSEWGSHVVILSYGLVSTVQNTYIDDIVIDDAPAYRPVDNLTATPISQNTLRLKWKEPLNISRWHVKVSHNPDFDPNSQTGDIFDGYAERLPFDVTSNVWGSGETVYIFVNPVYGTNTEYNIWQGISCMTQCGLTLPYFNDFEDEVQGSAANILSPMCWQRGNGFATLTSTTTKPYIDSADATSHFIKPDSVGPAVNFGMKALKIYSTAAERLPYTILPELLDGDIKDLYMSLFVSNKIASIMGSESKNCLKVGVTDSFGIDTVKLANGVVELKNVEEVYKVTLSNKATKPVEVRFDFSQYSGNGKFIVLYSDTNTITTLYVDNLRIGHADDLWRVYDLKIDEAATTSTSLKVQWSTFGNNTNWEVKVFDKACATLDDINSTSNVVTSRVVSETSAVIEGLSPGKYYYFYVRPVKTDGENVVEVGEWSAGICKGLTQCGAPMSIPYFEDFEAYAPTNATTPFPVPCFDDSHSTKHPYIASKDGSQTLYINPSSTNNVIQLDLPVLSEPINQLQMQLSTRFYGSTSSIKDALYKGTGIIHFGVVTSDGVFHKVRTFETHNYIDWQDWTVDFSTYEGENGRISIQASKPAKGSCSFYIDNISIDKTCKIGQVQCAKLDSTSAQIRWHKRKVASQYTVALCEFPTSQPDTIEHFKAVVTDTSHTFTDLQPSTAYYAYVKVSVASDGCTDVWSEPLEFMTRCQALPTPYFNNFDDCTTAPGTAMTPVDCATNLGDVPFAEAGGMYLTSPESKNGTTFRLNLSQLDKSLSNYYVLPPVQCNDVRDLQLSMKVSGWTANKIQYFEIGAMSDLNDLTTYLMLYLDSVTSPYSQTWKEVYYDFTKYAPSDGVYGKYIVIRVLESLSGTTRSSGSLHIDDLLIDKKTSCSPPSDLRCLKVEATTAQLTWDNNSQATDFTVRLFNTLNASIDPGSAGYLDQSISGKDTIMLQGLAANTVYTAFVRANCSETDKSGWSPSMRFRTGCSDVQALPYAEGFEGAMKNATLPSCWTNLNYGTINSTHTYGQQSAKVYINSSDYVACSGTGVLFFPNKSDVISSKIATPRLDLRDKTIKDVYLCFSVRSTAASKMKIYALTDDDLNLTIPDLPYTGSTTINNQTTETPNAQELLTLDFTAGDIDKYLHYGVRLSDIEEAQVLNDNYKYICFENFEGSGTIMTLDNVWIDTTANHLMPVSDLKMTNRNSNSIVISFRDLVAWTPAYQLACVKHDEELPSTFNSISKSGNEASYTFNDLDPDTKYDIYVRTWDEKGMYSTWEMIEVTTHKTSLEFGTIYQTGFEASDGNENWTMINNGVKANGDLANYPNHLIFGDAAQCDATGTTALFVSNDNAHYSWSKYFYNTQETNNSYVYAYLMLHLSKGWYHTAVKVKNPGGIKTGAPHYYDHFAALIAPSKTIIKNGNDKDIVYPDGSVYTMSIEPDAAASAYQTLLNAGLYVVCPKFYGEYEWKWVERNIFVDKEGEYMLILKWNNYMIADQVLDPAAIDSVSIRKIDACVEPTDIAVEYMDIDEATITWASESNSFEYILRTDSTLDPFYETEGLIQHGNIEGYSLTLNGLQPCTDYYLFLRGICGTDIYTPWQCLGALNGHFHTPCEATSLPHIRDFSTPAFATTNANREKDCYTFLGKATTTDGVSYTSGQDTIDDGIFVKLNPGDLIVLPHFEESISDLSVQLDMRGHYNNTGKEGEVAIGVVDDRYSSNLLEILGRYNIQRVGSGNTNHKHAIPLETYTRHLGRYSGAGRYIAIKNISTTSGSIIYLKRVAVSYAPCQSISALNAYKESLTDVSLTWLKNGIETAWDVKLSASGREDSIISLTLSDVEVRDGRIISYSLTDLPLGVLYQASVRVLCSEESESSWCQPTTFTTGCLFTLPSEEDFSHFDVTYNTSRDIEFNCWDVLIADGSIEQVFSGSLKLHKPKANENTSYLWFNTIDNIVSGMQLSDNKQACSKNTYSGNDGRFSKWLVTPEIILDAAENASIVLTFDAAYSTNQGDKTKSENDRFFVAVSTDGGTTWNRDNATEFDLDNDLTNKMNMLTVDLTKFKGQTIKLAFYHDNTEYGSLANFLTIDNIRISELETSLREDNACEGNEYWRNGFQLTLDQLPTLGEIKKYSRIQWHSQNSTAKDTLVVLQLTSVSGSESTISEKLCDQPFTLGENNAISFDYVSFDENTPFVAYLDNVYGCDSIVYVSLALPDTTDGGNYSVTLSNLPQTIDDHLTITANMNLVAGDTVLEVPANPDEECSDIIRYTLTVTEGGGQGLSVIDGDIELVEIYDCLGRRMGIIDQTTGVKPSLPAGVYLLRYRYFDGKTKTESYVIK